MKLFRWTIAAVLTVSAMSLCSVPSRADEWGSTGVRSGSETVGIYYYSVGGQVVLNNTYYTNYSTTLSPTSSGGTTYNTFCVDLLHEATTTYTQLATPSPALTSSYSGGLATNPGTVGDQAFGYAAWLANNYNSTATSADAQAGLQIAIWKVLYETTETGAGIENLASGSIQFSGNAAAISWATTYVTDWVNASSAAGSPVSSSAYLVNYVSDGSGDHAQYQLIDAAVHPTPEPSTLAIACLGVIGFVGYGLKHRRRRD